MAPDTSGFGVVFTASGVVSEANDDEITGTEED